MNKFLVTLSVCLVAVILLTACHPKVQTVAETVVVSEPGLDEVVVKEVVVTAVPAPGAHALLGEEDYARQTATTGQGGVDPQTGLNRMVIYNAELDLVVANTVQTVEAVQQIVQTAGGYIASSSTYDQGEQLRATMTVRVPADQLTSTLAQLKQLALRVSRETVSGEDVTDQYTDLESRLRNLEAAEQQYLEILDRADKIEDVMNVQRRLDEIRGEIEQAKGRMIYLSKSAALATVTVSITPDALVRPVTVGGWRPQGTARDAFEALLAVARTFVDAVIWSVICVLPVALFLGVPLYLAARWARRRAKAR
jgi:hypothetical protein